MKECGQLEFSDIKRKYAPRLTPKRWFEIYEMIKNFEPRNDMEQRDKALLHMMFIEGKTTREICEEGTIKSKRWIKGGRKPMSQRQIENILFKYVPDYGRKNRKAKKTTTPKVRSEQTAIKQKYLREGRACAVCGSTENLEIHHMIPIDMGGTNDAANLIVLCRYCHYEATQYYIRMKRQGAEI